MHYWPLLLIFFVLAPGTWAQDERYFRHLLKGDLTELGEEPKMPVLAQYTVSGPRYLLDLNSDGVEEVIIPQKREGIDWIEIRDSSGRILFEAKLLQMGGDSQLYKIKLVNITPNVKTLILYLDEGVTSGKLFFSSARIFLLAFENNDLTTMKITKGPHIFSEKKAQREQYWRRYHLVNVVDLDHDGKREIIVHYNHIQHIFKYASKGNWIRY